MVALAVGETSDCANPALDLYTQIDGILANVVALEFQIFSSSGQQIYPTTPGQRATVDLAACPAGHRLSTGHYVAVWTVANPTTAGRYELRWYITPTAGAVPQLHVEPLEVLAASAPVGVPEPYALVADLRAEGVSTSMANDARAYELLLRATETIDRVTGLWFGPREGSFLLDGPGSETLFLQMPIIGLRSVSIDGAVLDLATIASYSRHLSQRLVTPDDRRNPRLVRKPNGEIWEWSWIGSSTRRFRGPVWPYGNQNVALNGVFGWTDPTAATCGPGVVPRTIRNACLLLAVRELEQYAAPDRVASRRMNDIRSETTRDQSVSYADRRLGRLVPAYGTTGDPEVDAMIARYRPPMKLDVAGSP